MNGKYRIVIAEDCRFVREALRSLICVNAEFEVVGEAEDGGEAIQRVGSLRPDLILIDLSMPKMMGWEAIREIKARFPETKVLTLTVHKGDDFISASFRAGADGYALKDSTHAELLEAIRNVLNGRDYISPGIAKSVIKGFLEARKVSEPVTTWDSLTHREVQIVKLLAEGNTHKKIADYLCISPKTVAKHRSNIGKKLNIHDRAKLTALGVRKKLIVE